MHNGGLMEGFIINGFIPAWIVALNMLVAGLMLRLAYKKQLRLSSTTLVAGNTMLIEAMVYTLAFQLFGLDDATKIIISRFMVITICMSFYLPLLVSYIRSKRRDI